MVLPDGTEQSGQVSAASGGTATVTLSDETALPGDTAEVLLDGESVGSGTLYIHSELRVTGFAGTVADAFSLLERFEAKLEKYSGSLKRAAVSLAQEWRTDKVMRQLNAMLIVADKEELLIVSGTGEVIDPDDGIAAIGSGGMFALSAAKALKENTDLSAAEIATKAIKIASDICIYTNSNITMEEI